MRAMAARWYARRSGAGRRPVQKLVDVLHRLGISIRTGELPQRVLLERRQRLRTKSVAHVLPNQCRLRGALSLGLEREEIVELSLDPDLESLHADHPTSSL